MAGTPREPWANGSIEPGLLLLRGVHRQKGPEAIRAHIAGDDQEIARWDFREEAVLIAERDNPHVVTPIHLATAILWKEMTGADLVMATHDASLGLAAQAHGLTVVGA